MVGGNQPSKKNWKTQYIIKQKSLRDFSKALSLDSRI